MESLYVLREPTLGPILVIHASIFFLKVGYFDFVKNILKTARNSRFGIVTLQTEIRSVFGVACLKSVCDRIDAKSHE